MTTAVLIAWVVSSPVLAVLIGRSIRIGNERDGALPARIDPRAGQYAEQARLRVVKAAPGAFTGLLAGLVLVAVGLVQQTLGAA